MRKIPVGQVGTESGDSKSSSIIKVISTLGIRTSDPF